MKGREPRQRVHVPARMRCGSTWTDVCIKNMSSRGLMAETKAPPEPKTYIEIRRGTRVIVGRVVWSREGCFGIRSQDRLDIAAIVNDPRLGGPPVRSSAAPASGQAEPVGERRSAARTAAKAERSRHRGRAMQFVLLVLFGGAAAVGLGAIVFAMLSAPIRAIEQALSR